MPSVISNIGSRIARSVEKKIISYYEDLEGQELGPPEALKVMSENIFWKYVCDEHFIGAVNQNANLVKCVILQQD